MATHEYSILINLLRKKSNCMTISKNWYSDRKIIENKSQKQILSV